MVILMDSVDQNLANWRGSHMKSIPRGGLLSRNPVVYKWQAPFRCWLMREAVFWRVTDLLVQSKLLYDQGHGLGARILLRSGFETVSSLIYLNMKAESVASGELDFWEFSSLTSRLTVGSKNSKDGLQSINVMTTLKKADRKYPGVLRAFENLSESAHPNFEGLVWGYSKVDHDEDQTDFSNRWMELYGDEFLTLTSVCMEIFDHEYGEVWPVAMEHLERWISENDSAISESMPAPKSS